MRCGVEYLTEISDCRSHSVRIVAGGAHLFFTSGDIHVLVFHMQEKKVTTVLRFETPVTCLTLSDDELTLYALCEDGLYCTTLSPHSSSSAFSVNKSCDPVLISVSDDSLVLRNVSLQAVIVVEKILVTLGLHKSFWNFDVYEEPGSNPLHKLACFQVTTVNPCPSNTREDLINITDKEKSVSSSPVLTCIYPAVSTPLRAHSSELHPSLELRLFRLLFGVDASLVNSPVILCGLPDGRICFFPLFLPQMAGPRGDLRSPIRVLQSLEQPIVFIGTCNSEEHGSQCLVAVGQRGKLLLVRSKQIKSEGREADYSFNEHSIRGPVMCACVDDKCLYYSSLNDLQALQLTKTSASPEAAAAAEAQLPDLSSDSLGVCRVVALTGPYTSATGSVHLLALSLSGRLLQVTLPQETNKENISRFSSSQTGQRMKDLLASIGNVWEKAESLKHKLQEKNDSLKRLNQVMNICNLLLTNHENKNELDTRPIGCCGVARWSPLLQRDCLTLTCVLENLSTYTLEQGWTLCLQVHPLSHSQSTDMEYSSRTYSFPFRKLDCGQKLNVTIPLKETGALPVHVYCSLTFSLTALFEGEASQSLGVSQILTGLGSISVPLNTLTVDWLDALRLEGSFSPGNIIGHTTTDSIQDFLHSKGVLPQASDIPPKSGPLAVVVRVSSELLKTKLQLSSTSSAQICSSVLTWLVYKSATPQHGSVQTPFVCAYSPDGHPVKLLAKEETWQDFSSEGPLDVLEIRVESLSVAAVCGLHHAILRRLQVLLKDTSTKCWYTKPLQAQRLCETVRHVESLYKDLQDTYNQAALGGSIEINRSSETLFRIFLQLRANPLAIL